MTTPTDTDLEDLLRTTFETYAAHPDPQRAQALAATVADAPPRRRWTPVLLAAGVAGALVLGGGVIWSQMRPAPSGASVAPTSGATRGAYPPPQTSTDIDPAVLAQAEAAANRTSSEAAVEQLRAAAIARLPAGAQRTEVTIAAGETLQSVFGNLVYRAEGLQVDEPVAQVLDRLRMAGLPGMAPSDDSSYELPNGATVHSLSFQRAGTAAHTALHLRYAVVPDGRSSLVKVEVGTSWRPARSVRVGAGGVLSASVDLVDASGAVDPRTRALTPRQVTSFVDALNSWYPAPPVDAPGLCPLAPDAGSRVVLDSRHWNITLTPQPCSGSVVVTTTSGGGLQTAGQPTPAPVVSYLEDWARLRAVLDSLGIR